MNTELGTVLDVDLDAIAANVRVLARASGTDVIAVVKGDGYGHGAEASGWAALDAGAAMLAVFSVEEGRALRHALPDADIVVLLGALGEKEARAAIDNRLVLTVWTEESARTIALAAAAAGTTGRVHVKVDTGMTRLGTPIAAAPARYRAIAALDHIEVEGIFTHLANANELVDTATDVQIARFRDVVESIGPRPRWVHVAASSIERAASARDFCTAIRPGRALFGPGLPAVDGSIALRSPITWRSSVARVERVPPGTPVSYGGTYRTHRATNIATIPVGYGHGLPRSGSPGLQLLVGGEALPVVGRVSMDSVMLDVGDRLIFAGDEVIIVGSQSGVHQSVLDVAEACGTIAEELTTRIAPRVPRRYYARGHLVATKTLAEGFSWC